MAGNDATLKIVGLNEKMRDFDGAEVVLKGPDGKPLPEEQQLTLGNVLLGLITRMNPPQEPRRIILARRVGEAIAEVMSRGVEGSKSRAAAAGEGASAECRVPSAEYTAGSAALSVLREATRQNGPGYTVPVLAQVWLAIGDGEAEQQ